MIKLKIKLEKIINALEMSDVDNKTYFNKNTGEVLWSMDNNSEYSTYTEKDEFDNNIIYMFGFNSKNDYEIMEMFIETINDLKIRGILLNEITKKHPFRNFKNKLIDYGMEDVWYVFKDNKYKEIAINWCIKNNIEYYE